MSYKHYTISDKPSVTSGTISTTDGTGFSIEFPSGATTDSVITTGGIGATTSSIKIPVGTRAQDIDIRKVDNGYIVSPARGGMFEGAASEPLAVFNDFYEMCNWMREHFSEPEPESDDSP